MQNRGNNLCRQKKKSPPFYERISVITRRNLCCGGKEPLFLLYIIKYKIYIDKYIILKKKKNKRVIAHKTTELMPA